MCVVRPPHGEYLPWVQKACGLRPQYASKLIKAAEWANVAHVQHLEGTTDIATLFILSADTTPEDVREWFMERCAAGYLNPLLMWYGFHVIAPWIGCRSRNL